MIVTNVFKCLICYKTWNETIDLSKGTGYGSYKTNCPSCGHKIDIPIVYADTQKNYWPEYLTESLTSFPDFKKDKHIMKVYIKENPDEEIARAYENNMMLEDKYVICYEDEHCSGVLGSGNTKTSAIDFSKLMLDRIKSDLLELERLFVEVIRQDREVY